MPTVVAAIANIRDGRDGGAGVAELRGALERLERRYDALRGRLDTVEGKAGEGQTLDGKTG